MKTIRTLAVILNCLWACLAVPAFGQAPDAKHVSAARPMRAEAEQHLSALKTTPTRQSPTRTPTRTPSPTASRTPTRTPAP